MYALLQVAQQAQGSLMGFAIFAFIIIAVIAAIIWLVVTDPDKKTEKD